MTRDDILEELFRMQDSGYAIFQAKLIPTIDANTVIGVRTPILRKFAKELASDEGAKVFTCDLPHNYFEENQLHSFIISLEKDFDKCVKEVDDFLPYVDNWATCDQLSPKVFKKNKEQLLPYIDKWINSTETYTIRFAIGMLMQHFLDEEYCDKYADMVAGVKSEEYYVNMMIAWYFATALAKQYDAIVPYLKEYRLSNWLHNKTIQKAIESYRIRDEQKQYLRKLKIKNGH